MATAETWQVSLELAQFMDAEDRRQATHRMRTAGRLLNADIAHEHRSTAGLLLLLPREVPDFEDGLSAALLLSDREQEAAGLRQGRSAPRPLPRRKCALSDKVLVENRNGRSARHDD